MSSLLSSSLACGCEKFGIMCSSSNSLEPRPGYVRIDVEAFWGGMLI